MEEIALEGEVLKIGVGQQQCQRPRAFISLSALDAHPTALHHIEAAPSLRPHYAVHLRDQQLGVELSAVHRHRDARFKANHHFGGLDCREPGHRVDVGRRLATRVFDDPTLDGPTPQILVDGVQLLLGHRQRDVPLGGVFDAVLTGQSPHPGGGNDLEVGRQCPGADLETHLVVAHRFSSMEDSFSLVTDNGMSHLAAYSILSSRVSPHTRAGAMTSRSGANARVPTSKRTWSLPLPVHPWATAEAPCRRASATRWRTMTGRDRAETSGYFPSYLALANRAGMQKSSAISARASMTVASMAPAARARLRMASQSSFFESAAWPTSTATAMTSTP